MRTLTAAAAVLLGLFSSAVIASPPVVDASAGYKFGVGGTGRTLGVGGTGRLNKLGVGGTGKLGVGGTGRTLGVGGTGRLVIKVDRS